LGASFEDVRPNHDIYNMYRSILEGTIFNCFQGYESLLSLSNIKPRIVLSGGILYSPLWTQICVDIFGQEMEASRNPQSSMFGAIILGLIVLNMKEQVRLLLKSENNEIISPDAINSDHYSGKYKNYLKWYEITHSYTI
jgi:gluconokinase